ncbi:MAG: ATP-binding protein [Lachnospiraceae bacterium]
MRKKINAELVLIAALAILMTGVLATITYYGTFKTEVFNSLKTCTHVLADSEIYEGQKWDPVQLTNESLRVTVVSPDGTVIMDSNADIGDMSNHGKRPEIAEAFEKGEGKDIRRSETVDKSTFYYALKMEDGNVLRLAKEAGSIVCMFWDAIPPLLAVTVVLFAFCAVLAGFLTKSFIEPVEKMAENLDDFEVNPGYSELVPFLTTIQKQHKDIIKNARLRQEFTANVSHELKTPLTSISGYAELIETGMASENDTRHFAKEIHRNANRLLRLINDILQLSEMDNSEGITEREPLNILTLAQNCVEMLQINAQEHGIRMQVEGEEAWVLGNRSMIEEVLYNLCDNAIRYNTENGSASVLVRNEGEVVLLQISDTGIGIPQEHQERIFERFYRVDKSRSKERGGTGLGLAIVKHILSEHGAQIDLESTPGKGTTVRVRFPKRNLE